MFAIAEMSLSHFQGNSNSLSTVDVGASFTGLTSYFPVANVALTFANTYGSIVVALLLFVEGEREKLAVAAAAFLLTRAFELVKA